MLLDSPINGVEIVPPLSSFPEAVVYLCIDDELVLADLCTPIFDRLKERGASPT